MCVCVCVSENIKWGKDTRPSEDDYILDLLENITHFTFQQGVRVV